MREAVFANIGTEIKESGVMNALRESNLDYTVHTENLFTTSCPEITTHVATVSDNGAFKGIVSPKYSIVQNKDAFSFIDDIPDAEIVRAGETQTGMVYVIAALPKVSVLGDEFIPYVIAQNSFNGRYNTKAAISPLRIVCQNQFNLAFKKSTNVVTIRHSKSATIRMEDAFNTLRASAAYMANLNEAAEKYASMKLAKSDIRGIVESLFPVNEKMSERTRNTVLDKREQFIACYRADDNANFRGTVWGILNAGADYISHATPARNTANFEENRFITVLTSDFYNQLASIACAKSLC